MARLGHQEIGTVQVGEQKYPLKTGEVLSFVVPVHGSPRVVRSGEKVGDGENLVMFNPKIAEAGKVTVITRGVLSIWGKHNRDDAQLLSGSSFGRGETAHIRQNGRNSHTYMSLSLNQ